jgi:hypothetical protein
MHRRIGLLIAAVAFLVLVAAVSTATALTTATPTTLLLPQIRKDATPTATPTATATATATPTATPPTSSDDFSNPNSGWPVVEDSTSKIGYLNGEYQIFIKSANIVLRVGYDNPIADFQVELDARDAASIDGSNGIYFGSTNAGFYDFEVGYGQFALFRYDLANPPGASLIDPTTSPAIQSGNASNHLKVTRSGTTITLFANGTQLAQINDGTLGPGGVGMVASSFSPNFDVRFDNFLLVEAAPQTARASGRGPSQIQKTTPLAVFRSKWSSIPR